ncbi:MAG TPA: crossover junction endodeoxyribonuclease RuvC [Syntrophomonadaceae bacterium]|nr:crossover junction endodeoxyribonuclease RuvC [Syntrophomonadaceae bacterium]HRX21553.1 crossover junction endodeoxyribonuclease RuvC [Syntrophomonadaceae bacterium]
MLVLGIDPGTATTGFGLIEAVNSRIELVRYGTVTTEANAAMSDRLCQICDQINEIITIYKPDVAAIEQIYYFKNAKTVITVAQSRGVIMMTAAKAGLEIAEYTPLQVKQSVVGYGKADKKQVQIMVQSILHMDTLPKPDDAADALAIAICHVHSCRMAKIYKGGLK